jgi:hypothetical protein
LGNSGHIAFRQVIGVFVRPQARAPTGSGRSFSYTVTISYNDPQNAIIGQHSLQRMKDIHGQSLDKLAYGFLAAYLILRPIIHLAMEGNRGDHRFDSSRPASHEA